MNLLRLAGISSGCVAALHVLIILLGGPAYRYFGAGERMAQLADAGSAVPTVLTAAVTVVFAAWAAYAFAGAGLLKRPPFLRTGLILSGSAYVLRGILIGPQLVWWVGGYRTAVPPRQLAFSVAALVTGLAYLAGTKAAWPSLSPRRRPPRSEGRAAPLLADHERSGHNPGEGARESRMERDKRYSIDLDVRYGPLEVVDVPALAAACTDSWYNRSLCRVNDCVVRLGVFLGEFHWHKHDKEDEFFHVVSGRLAVDLEGRTVELSAGQGFTVPRGVVHRTRATERTVVLMVEGAGVQPTGD